MLALMKFQHEFQMEIFELNAAWQNIQNFDYFRFCYYRLLSYAMIVFSNDHQIPTNILKLNDANVFLKQLTIRRVQTCQNGVDFELIYDHQNQSSNLTDTNLCSSTSTLSKSDESNQSELVSMLSVYVNYLNNVAEKPISNRTLCLTAHETDSKILTNIWNMMTNTVYTNLLQLLLSFPRARLQSLSCKLSIDPTLANIWDILVVSHWPFLIRTELVNKSPIVWNESVQKVQELNHQVTKDGIVNLLDKLFIETIQEFNQGLVSHDLEKPEYHRVNVWHIRLLWLETLRKLFNRIYSNKKVRKDVRIFKIKLSCLQGEYSKLSKIISLIKN